MIAALLAAILAAPAGAAAGPSVGILLLAHGGDASWNAEVEKLRAEIDGPLPAEVAFGMADGAEIQKAVDRLIKRGAPRVAAVPLFVQTRSEVMDQTRYVLGLSDKPSEVLKKAMAAMAAHAAMGHGAAHGHGAGHGHVYSETRLKTTVPVALADALDADPLAAEILLERARGLSEHASRETVVLVAHGPVDDAAMKAWNRSLSTLAASLKSRGRFKAVVHGMLRDDAPPPVRAAAVEALRAKVAAASKKGGRALVVPVLISRGGIEHKIARDLKDLDYKWDGRTLMPHPGFAAWALKRAKSLY